LRGSKFLATLQALHGGSVTIGDATVTRTRRPVFKSTPLKLLHKNIRDLQPAMFVLKTDRAARG
jgi:hypothetical protein